MKTLLQKAQNIAIRQKAGDLTREDMDLAIAWMKGTIGITQASSAYNKSTQRMGVYLRLARSLREAYKEGLIK